MTDHVPDSMSGHLGQNVVKLAMVEKDLGIEVATTNLVQKHVNQMRMVEQTNMSRIATAIFFAQVSE